MRECIIGILNFVQSRRCDWNLSIIPDPSGKTENGLTPTNVEKLVKDGVDGVITGIYHDTPGFRALVSSGIPTVLNEFPPNWKRDRQLPITCILNDNKAIGKMGAKYFLKNGVFSSYGFIPDRRKCSWSTYRRRGFELELAESNIHPLTYSFKKEQLDKWLLRLSKPAAVFVVNDNTAVNVMTTCKRLGIEVPDQLSIIGVDNDEIYCNSLQPTLTSIHPNHLEQGRRAAAELDRLMRTRRSNGEIYIDPIRVVERHSTRAIPPAGHLIKQGLSYISKHYQEGISASDVARHLGISEQLLRLRFKTIYGQSVRDLILEKRLDAAKSLLTKTDDPISTIAKHTGFSSACRFSHYFRQVTALSPQSWRAKNQLRNTSARSDNN